MAYWSENDKRPERRGFKKLSEFGNWYESSQNTCFTVFRCNQRGADDPWLISADFLNPRFRGLLPFWPIELMVLIGVLVGFIVDTHPHVRMPVTKLWCRHWHLEDPNLLKLWSLDSSFPFFLSDTSIWGQRTQVLQMLWSPGYSELCVIQAIWEQVRETHMTKT